MNLAPMSRRVPRAGVRGLSLVEAMLTTVVLGIGVMSVANTFRQASTGVRGSRLATEAMRIAEQRLERLSTVPANRLAVCAGPVTGCRATREQFASELGAAGTFRCTQYVDEMGFHDPTAVTTGKYRVDTAVQAHTDPRQQSGALVVTVSVCWASADRVVEQVQLQRMIVPEV